MKSFHYCLVVLGIMTLLGVSAISSSNLAFAEINTDKSTYAKGELLEVSGSLDLQTDETVNIVKIEITNLNDENNKIVDEYTPIDDNNAFTRSYETVTWESGEYKVTIRYNESNEETKFEISDSSSSLSEADTTAPGTGSSSSTGNDETDTTAPGSSSVDPQPVPVVPSNESDTMNNQVLTLQSENQQLRDENNHLKTQIEELNKRIEQLDAIVKEQIRVMMETLAVVSTTDDDATPGTGSNDDDATPGTGSNDDDATPGTSDNDIGIPGALKPGN